MMLLFFLAAGLVAFAQDRILAVMRAQTVRIKHWGGVILIAVGAWLMALAVWAGLFARIFPV